MNILSKSKYYASIEEIINEARLGKMFILADDEDRENEGDLIIPAEKASPEIINFMAKHARGLICLALTEERCKKLNLPLMRRQNQSRFETAFTVSIESRDGVTTGISVADRAKTIEVAIDENKDHNYISTPGHVFPLMSRNGGVLVRSGHTEAAVDIARLAGLNPSGVICEIMNDDGTMARMPDLINFANKHDLKIARIADLIAFRRLNDSVVKRSIERPFNSIYGKDWQMIVFTNTVDKSEHIALVKGDVKGDDPVLVRVHVFNIMKDLLGEKSRSGAELSSVLKAIGDAGKGVVVLIRESLPTSLSDRILFELGEEVKKQPLRDYGVGAQIIADLGVKNMILLTSSKRSIVGLEGHGLSVVDRRSLSF
ncbi:3,4-dihydroxy-2-butanone-4-phosphate synthase [Alphaproteobacteria bacterium]|nr:3,4-dihydroxy-2-butanone-4-phosphate synthase [Alphaproteobacteria bacterium]